MTEFRKRRILVVDDNAEVVDPLRESLQAAGHEVVVATDAPAALDLAKSFLPEIALLDIELGDINGYELGLLIHEIPALERCVLIAITGYSQEHGRDASRRAGFHHFVKPIDLDRLLGFIETLPT